MQEKVRLVIWDLDETFWSGTLTEGGIKIRPEHCEIVKILAKRGIMSSICSKNDFEPIKAILEKEGVWDYFIFPSIDWSPKGPRIAALVDAVQLRAPTILFVDDNPMNLAEVEATVPGIQVQRETFIPEILSHPLFAGKDDSGLTRLAQYKLLETRKKDEQAAGGDNTDFLRKSNIRVHIEYDVAAHIDRAVELINRTNQLNYTKRRLPEDPEKARSELLAQLSDHGNQAGLVRVVDNYGDYGFVGFYLIRNFRKYYVDGKAPQTLVQYCFSCRTLGMFVEQWLYQHLREPELQVVGEVLTDLAQPRTIDWVRLAALQDDGATKQTHIAPAVRFLGGCEVNAVSHYLTAYADEVSMTGNFAAGGLFVRVNSVSLLRAVTATDGEAARKEAEILGLPYEMLGLRYFQNPPPGTIFIFDGGFDSSPSNSYYRHRDFDWAIRIEAIGNPFLLFTEGTDSEVLAGLDRLKFASESDRENAISAMWHVRKSYKKAVVESGSRLVEMMRKVFSDVPVGSKMFVIIPAECQPGQDNVLKVVPWLREYNLTVRRAAAELPYIHILDYQEFVQNASEMQGNNHYDRMVHFRLAKAIISRASEVPARTQ
jgi:FkbH-like protein